MTDSFGVQQLIQKPIIQGALLRLQQSLPDGLFYHVASHTDDVLHESMLFAHHDMLNERERELIAISAAYHDLGFIDRAKENEGFGAEEAKRAMSADGSYNPEEILLVSTMILDTTVQITAHGPRQVPTTPLSPYLLDADVSNLGRNDFFDKAELVRKEVGIEDRAQFLRGLLTFVNSHIWYSPAAKTLRGEQKLANMAALEKIVAQL